MTAPITEGELETAAEERKPAPPRGPTPKGRAHVHADDLPKSPRVVRTIQRTTGAQLAEAETKEAAAWLALEAAKKRTADAMLDQARLAIEHAEALAELDLANAGRRLAARERLSA